MESAKQKVKDLGSAAKEKAQIYGAKVEEKAGKAGAMTGEGKEIAKENRKAKEAEAKADLHASKARHVDEKGHHHVPGVTGHKHYPPATGGAAGGYTY
ncbi:hypothetical protein V2J09_004749 [Rumex salicifolius]